MELTTNEILGGFTAVIGFSNLLAAVYLAFRMRQHARNISKGGVWNTILHDEDLTVMLGVVLRALAVSLVFIMRLPLRSMRLADELEMGNRWLDMTIYWESLAAAVTVFALGFVMWPAFKRWGLVKTVATVLILSVGSFAIGVVGVEILAGFL